MATATRKETVTQTVEESLLDKVLTATCDKLDRIAGSYCQALSEVHGRIARAMILADGVEKLRGAITPDLMRRLMGLQGSQLGFKTDKDKEGGYKEHVVKECFIESLLLGLEPTGNEWNIIAGRCYVTKEGFQRKVREIPGLTDLEESPGIPLAHNGHTVVRYAARWKYEGRPMQLIDAEGKPGRVFAIRVNQGMGTDAIIGKAQRKALKAIYESVHGSLHTPADGDAIEEEPSIIPGHATQAQLETITECVQSLQMPVAKFQTLLPSGVPVIARLSEVQAAEIIKQLAVLLKEQARAEPDSDDPALATITPEQGKEINDLIKANGADQAAFLERYQVRRLGELPAEHYRDALMWVVAQAKDREPGEDAEEGHGPDAAE